MLNINELENRYKKYRFKIYAMYALIFVLIIFISVLIFFTISYVYNSEIKNNRDVKYAKNNLESDTNISKHNLAITIKNESNTTNNKDTNITGNQANEKNEDTKIIFTPSLDFMKNIQSNISKNSEASNKTTDNRQALAIQIKKEEKITPKEENLVKIDITPKNEKNLNTVLQQKKQTVNIENKFSEKVTISKEDSDIRDVIKRFNINKNPALSLFIAKKYYQLNEYENAYNYALATNNIDSNIDESWIIFSKSLVKLNQKDKAIQTLEQYISYSKSQNAKMFLDDLKSGKFK